MNYPKTPQAGGMQPRADQTPVGSVAPQVVAPPKPTKIVYLGKPPRINRSTNGSTN